MKRKGGEGTSGKEPPGREGIREGVEEGKGGREAGRTSMSPSPNQLRSQDTEVGGATWRARSASLYGSFGASPSGIQGHSPWSGGEEAGDILYFN
jgi:hypothetical protein